MKVSSNMDLVDEDVLPFLAQIREDVFETPSLQAVGIAAALETGGPDDGVGVSAFAYDRLGRWEPIGVANADDDPIVILEKWVETSYGVVGPWCQCLVQILWNGGSPRAHIEFEFEDGHRWLFSDSDRFLGDRLRPSELPTPLKKER